MIYIMIVAMGLVVFFNRYLFIQNSEQFDNRTGINRHTLRRAVEFAFQLWNYQPDGFGSAGCVRHNVVGCST